jgi:hypothetical protein
MQKELSELKIYSSLLLYHEIKFELIYDKNLFKNQESVSVIFPEINIKFVPIEQKIKLSDIDEEYKNELIEKYNMKIDGEYGLVKNYVGYAGGMGGLAFHFKNIHTSF